jgi:hypothetical protein
VAERREDPDRGVQPGHHVDERDADLPRLAVGIAGDAHQATHGLGQEVVARHVTTADPQDRAVDDAGVRLSHRRLVQAEPPRHPGSEVLDQDVGASGQVARGGQIVGVGEVERHARLVPVEPQVVARLAVGRPRRSPPPGVVAVRVLHLDHVGAQIAEEHRGERPGEDAGEVRHEDAVEGARLPLGHGQTVSRATSRRGDG